MLATPLGTGIFRYLALHLTIPRLHPVDEFRAVSAQSDGVLIAYAFATAVALPLAWRGGAGLRRLLPVVGLGALAAHSVRFGADFALAAAPLLAVAASLVSARLAKDIGHRARRWSARRCWSRCALGPRVAAARAGHRFVQRSWTSGSIARRCRWRRSSSPRRTACATACTTTSRSART